MKKSKAKDSDDDSGEDYSTTVITDVNAKKDNFAPAPYATSAVDVRPAPL